ncbi:carbohydrate kinase family protein [Candidatus Wolfebacteria bacterium]|nr:carbohydrate kinase family protein [Candidatus Wolfebacteria bacterium]
MKKLDFLGIGDPVIDAFIKLKNPEITCDIDDENCKISMNWGDKIPFEGVTVVPAVGNAANATVSAHRLGLKSGLMAWIGDDKFGDEIENQLKKEGIDTTYLTRQKGIGSNYHYVLSYKAERTILVKHFEYDYKLPRLAPPKYMYLSSLAENSIPFQHEIVDFVKRHPDVRLAFQPGTFQINQGYEALKDLYQASYLFFCNKEEAQRILETKESNIEKLLVMMHKKGPKIPIISDGPRGAHSYDGNRHLFVPMYPDPKPPIDRTGAGDSFSSTVVAALALGEPLDHALLWGPINSMSVVQYIGAQEGLLKRGKLLDFLENAPADYKVQEL